MTTVYTYTLTTTSSHKANMNSDTATATATQSFRARYSSTLIILEQSYTPHQVISTFFMMSHSICLSNPLR